MSHRIAVLLPCYNEALTIAKVIGDFQRHLPDAKIIVFDNNSTDGTSQIARENGADVVHVPRQGKGNVVIKMLERVDADYLILADGDDTYSAEDAKQLLEPILKGKADMAVGTRFFSFEEQSFRSLHMLGNRLVRKLINTIYSTRLTDIMSGYRAFTAELARNLPLTSVGFEIETEMTLQTLYYGYVIEEVPIHYGERPEGSTSKLRTFHDGFRVLWTIFNTFRSAKPLTFFGLLAIALALLSVVAALPAIIQFGSEGVVKSWPLLSVSVGLGVISFTSAVLGILLHTLNVRFKEMAMLIRKSSPVTQREGHGRPIG